MADRAAIVTGGSSGIGYEIARTLADMGYGVTIAGRREDKLRAAADELRSEGDRDINDVVCDAASEEAVVALVKSHADRYGRIDVLVNNAGVGIGAAIEGYPTKYLDLQLDVNIRSHIICTREALPLLKQAGAEHGTALIVNTASIAGRYGQPWLSIYAATKAAMINWSNGLFKEVQNDGIKVTALSPAFVETPMTTFAQEGGVPPEDMIRPEDISSVIPWLLSLSKNARIPNIVFERVNDNLF